MFATPESSLVDWKEIDSIILSLSSDAWFYKIGSEIGPPRRQTAVPAQLLPPRSRHPPNYGKLRLPFNVFRRAHGPPCAMRLPFRIVVNPTRSRSHQIDRPAASHLRCGLGRHTSIQSKNEHSRPIDPIVFEILQCAVGICKRISGNMRSQRNRRRLGQELAPVVARVGGHRSQFLLVKQRRSRSRAAGSATDKSPPTASVPPFSSCAQRRRNQFTRRCKHDAAVRFLGHFADLVTDPGRSHLAGQFTV